MILKTLEDLKQKALLKPPARIAVAAAADQHVIEALKNAMDAGIVSPLLVGDKVQIETICRSVGLDLAGITITDEPDHVKATALAVQYIRDGEADILMKGKASTAVVLKAVLDKVNGISKTGLLSHIAFFESPHYHKLLCLTDSAINILPGLNDKAGIIRNVLAAYSKLGCSNPKVTILAAVENVNEKMEATVHASLLTTMNKRGQIEGCIIDGPLAFDNAVSKEACEQKGIVSEVGGDSDIILCPNIETGNAVYKTMIYLGGATCAGVVLGANVPVVLTSRSDSERSKFMSIALAVALGREG